MAWYGWRGAEWRVLGSPAPVECRPGEQRADFKHSWGPESSSGRSLATQGFSSTAGLTVHSRLHDRKTVVLNDNYV